MRFPPHTHRETKNPSALHPEITIRSEEEKSRKIYFVRLVVAKGIFSTSKISSFPALSFFGFLV
jgi:hypothetical protein